MRARSEGEDRGRPGTVVRSTVLAVVILAGACGQREPQPLAEKASPELADRRVVNFRSDGVRLEGTVYGEGHVGLILAGGKGGQFQWGQEFPRTLAQERRMVLTYNWRGVCPKGPGDSVYGCSQGDPDATVLNTCGVPPSKSTIPNDIVAGIEFMRSQGAENIFLIGEGHIGGNGSIYVAAEHPDIAGLVSLSGGGPCEVYGLEAVPRNEFQRISVPTLVIETPGSYLCQLAYVCIGKELLLVRDVGVGVLFGDEAEEVTAAIVDFVVRSERR